MAISDADKVAGKSDMLPTHSGSYRNYDIKITTKLNQVLQTNGIDPLKITNLTETQVIALINKIENDALTILTSWTGKLN